ncbi:MAG TPA: hypothetical protein VFK88_10320 [Gallionella sp.]|nr:hypothetical protein [Gallionella sp.]
MKRIALILIALLIGWLSWWLIQSGHFTVTINGRALSGPLDAVLGGWGLLVTITVLFCVAILLAFIFAGVGLAILGILLFVTMIFLVAAMPLLLPLLLPLFIVWAFVAGTHRRKSNPPKQNSSDSQR